MASPSPSSSPASSPSSAAVPPASLSPSSAFGAQPPLPPRVRGRVPDSRARRFTILISILVHALAALGAIAYSFWHIEEISPARVTVTFVSAAALPPPPPPPPPPLGGDAAPSTPKRRATPRTKVETVRVPETPKPTPVVEAPKVPVVELPKEPPPVDPKPHGGEGAGSPDGVAGGVKDGVAGGVKGGVSGGTVGGTPGAPAAAPKFLPPQMGAQLKLSGSEPGFPPFLRRPGANYLVLAKICVGVSGNVDSVTLQKRAEPTLDNNVITAVKGWRFKPMTANGAAVPFCYFGRFEFKSE